MRVSVAYDFLPKTPSAHAAVVMDHFGVGFETGRHVIADDLELPIQPGDVVCFTGPSGSGKSSLMRAAATTLASRSLLSDRDAEDHPRAVPSSTSRSLGSDRDAAPRVGVVWCDALELGERLLVDGLGLPADEALSLLAACGLGEAQLLLRSPRELSDGQRYRYRLAKALALQPAWLVADEFTAALDRTLAKVIALNLRKLAARTGVGCLLATTHEDIVPDLQPDVHVRCRLDGRIAVEQHRATTSATTHHSPPTTHSAKKKRSASRANCGCLPAPVPTGRTSLGGITAVITSASCGS